MRGQLTARNFTKLADPEVTVTGYTAPSTGQAVRAVLFDTFGTVVDWRSGVSSAVRAFAAAGALTLDPGEFADAWRAQYQPSMERVRSGLRPYVSLDTLHSENLDTVLRSHDIDPGAFAPGELASLWPPPGTTFRPGQTAWKVSARQAGLHCRPAVQWQYRLPSLPGTPHPGLQRSQLLYLPARV